MIPFDAPATEATVRALELAGALEHPAILHHSLRTARLASLVAAGEGQFLAGDVAAFIELLLAILEGREHEEVRALVEPRLAQPDAVHDPVAKCPIRHYPLLDAQV